MSSNPKATPPPATDTLWGIEINELVNEHKFIKKFSPPPQPTTTNPFAKLIYRNVYNQLCQEDIYNLRKKFSHSKRILPKQAKQRGYLVSNAPPEGCPRQSQAVPAQTNNHPQELCGAPLVKTGLGPVDH